MSVPVWLCSEKYELLHSLEYVDFEDMTETCQVYRAGARAFEDPDELLPLFYSPANNGFYTPRPGPQSDLRDNAYVNVGR